MNVPYLLARGFAVCEEEVDSLASEARTAQTCGRLLTDTEHLSAVLGFQVGEGGRVRSWDDEHVATGDRSMSISVIVRASSWTTLASPSRATSLQKRQLFDSGVMPRSYESGRRSGFDCSGFVKFVYGQLGLTLAHYAATQYLTTPHIDPSELEAGDLVFFEPHADGPGHVGIYIGEGS